MADTLVDAGPIIALLTRNDDLHEECTALFRRLNCAFYTTLPVLTESMYFWGRHSGHIGQAALWKMVQRGDLLLEHPSPLELVRMAELMEKYRDRPMDFADASLVALSERLGLTRIFTVDYNDFVTYRLAGNKSFTILGPRPAR